MNKSLFTVLQDYLRERTYDLREAGQRDPDLELAYNTVFNT